MPVLEAHDLHKTYIGGDGGTINVLSGVDLSVSAREMVAIIGASGAGKSTLLHVLGALEKPTKGYVVIGGVPISGLDEEQLARSTRIGTRRFLNQHCVLVPDLESILLARANAATGSPAKQANPKPKRVANRATVADSWRSSWNSSWPSRDRERGWNSRAGRTGSRPLWTCDC